MNALLALLAFQVGPTLDYADFQRYMRCTDVAARYAASSNETVAESARLAVSLCDDVRTEIWNSLALDTSEAVADRRMNALDKVLTARSERIVFRFRFCQQDVSCSTFMDDRGIPSPR